MSREVADRFVETRVALVVATAIYNARPTPGAYTVLKDARRDWLEALKALRGLPAPVEAQA